MEIGTVLGEAIRRGHSLGFVTLTMRHREGQALDLLWKAAGKGWTRAITGRAWVAVEPLVDGWVRVWEVTHGANGWHVHVHCVVVLAEGSGAGDLEVVASGMWERWARGLEAAGLAAPLLKGQDWHIATGEAAASDLADYLAKSVQVVDERANVATGLGLELTHTEAGRTQKGHATKPVWSLLDRLVETGEVEALNLWRTWEAGSKGRKQVGWSVGLRERFAVEVDELSDAQVVEQEVGTERDDLVRWTADEWRVFIAQGSRAFELLQAAEVGGRELVALVLADWPDAPGEVLDAAVIERDRWAVDGPKRTDAAAAGASVRPPAPATLDTRRDHLAGTCRGLGVQPPGMPCRTSDPVP